MQSQVAEQLHGAAAGANLEPLNHEVEERIAEGMARAEIIAEMAAEIGVLALDCDGPKRKVWPLHGKHCGDRRVQSAVLDAADKLQ